MSTKVEGKLVSLIHEIKEIKKELIFQKIEKTKTAEQKIKRWEVLGRKISGVWDKVSAVEEVRQQREKSW